ncbi:hypothetical protein EPZ47_03390 [Pseudomonas viciae]|uniref:Uncharacterized protein n=1 Tax=Pseudomonas viciae TaxID=2505979 RepID=A0A4P7PBP3_9PSED|nr:hypothetical protein EPZ47_03390 [Pseudomonas viciae]
MLQFSRARRDQNVGAGLIAIAVGQSTSMLDVRPPSRASSLPQGYRCSTGYRVFTRESSRPCS